MVGGLYQCHGWPNAANMRGVGFVEDTVYAQYKRRLLNRWCTRLTQIRCRQVQSPRQNGCKRRAVDFGPDFWPLFETFPYRSD